MGWQDRRDVSVLLGETIDTIKYNGEDKIEFFTKSGKHYRMMHQQDCCESVWVEDIIGDIADLIGSPILMAEEVTKTPDDEDPHDYHESATWTFYKFATQKGYVTIRWMGESNGYYSESVDFEEV